MANRRTLMTHTSIPELIGLYKHQLKMSKLEPGELCLVVTDMAFNPAYADACMGAAADLGAEILKITLPYKGQLPSKAWGAAISEADLVVYSTTHTLHYSKELRNALDGGTRIMMAVQPLHTMERLKGDLQVKYRTIAGAKLLRKAKNIHITSKVGTDLIIERGNRPVLSHYGIADEPGHLDFWGVGMIETALLEGNMEGTMVLNTGDQLFYLARYVEKPIKVTFEAGRIVDIQGGVDAFLMRKHLESFNEENAWNTGHLTIGADRRALWTAQALQFPEAGFSPADAESYYGNIQIEIGSNDDISFQGKNRSHAHLGHCMLNCNLYLDDTLFINEGEFVQPDLQ